MIWQKNKIFIPGFFGKAKQLLFQLFIRLRLGIVTYFVNFKNPGGDIKHVKQKLILLLGE
jgi:hypothetical protein